MRSNRSSSYLCSSPATRLCRNRQTRINVILSASEESRFFVVYETRSFGYRLRMTLRHSLDAGRMKEGDLNQGMGVFDEG